MIAWPRRRRYERGVKSFRHIIVTAVVIAAVLPTCMASFPLLLMLRDEIKSGSERELRLKAEKIASEVQHELWLIAQHTLDLSKDSGLRKLPTSELTSESVRTLLKDYLSANPAASQILILSADGRLLNSWPRNAGSLEVRPQWQQWLKNVDRSGGKFNHTDIQFLSENDPEFLEEMTVRNGGRRGTIRSSRFFSLFVPMVGPMTKTPTETTTSDRKAEIRSVLVAILPLERIAMCHQWRAPAGGWVDFLEGSTNSIQRLSGDPSRNAPAQIFAASPFEITHGAMGKNIPLTVQVSEPANVEFSMLRKQLLPVFLGLLAALAVVSVVAFVSSRQLAYPIHRLIRHARLIGAGVYHSPPPKLRFLELEELASTLGELGSRVAAEIKHRVEQETQKSELERARVESVLHSMLQQMQPHFLFNCLNNISSVIASEPDKASKMIQRLSDLYRFILEATKTTTSQLERELQIVREYLELQKMRYGQRLQYSIEVPSPVPNLSLPSLMLQTLAENAVKHGISKTRAGGKIEVKVTSLKENRYEIKITNTGGPLVLGSQGTGLENSRSRLNLLYGTTHGFSISATPSGATEVQFYLCGGNA